jgi:hypothetical protein
MPGVMIRTNQGDAALFATDRRVDPLIQELAEANGYRLVGR